MVTVHINSEASSSSSKSDPVEPERMIVVVTGANTGVGLGICHRLLSSLSLPLDRPITESLPQLSAFAPSQPQTLTTPHTPRAEMTLTLILACRSLQKAQVAKEELLKKHFGQLEKRRRKGMAAPSSWRNGLRIEIELLDVDSPNGENGILDFCGRMKERYPYITSFYSNAGIFAATKQHWGTMCLEVLQKGPAYTFSHSKGYMDEEVGRLSRDKKRGGVWGVNTFATYLLATELLPLLQQSPISLPFSPRIIYTTSSTADISDYVLTRPADLQLLTLRNSYAPSKYIGDLLINDFDRRHGLPPTQKSAPRAVRAFSGEPGCLATMAGKESMASSPLFGIIQFANWLVFALMRLFGSPWHPRDTEDATAALLYAALVPDAFLPPVRNSPRFKFNLVSHPLSDATVAFVPVDGGETREAEEVLKAQLEECERVRRECRAEAGLDRE